MPSKFTPAEREIGKADAAQRRKMPGRAGFLIPRERKYPSHDASGKLSKALLVHAEERATANRHPEVARRARAMLREHPSGAGGSRGSNGAAAREAGQPRRRPGQDRSRRKSARAPAAALDLIRHRVVS